MGVSCGLNAIRLKPRHVMNITSAIVRRLDGVKLLTLQRPSPDGWRKAFHYHPLNADAAGHPLISKNIPDPPLVLILPPTVRPELQVRIAEDESDPSGRGTRSAEGV